MSGVAFFMSTVRAAAAVSVFFRPTSEISKTTFITTVPYGQGVSSLINEETPDDDNGYADSRVSNGQNFQVQMTGSWPLPSFSGGMLRYRLKGSPGINGRIRVYLNNVLYGDERPGNDWQTYEVPLTQSDITSLIDSSGVVCKVLFNSWASGNRGGKITWIELEVF